MYSVVVVNGSRAMEVVPELRTRLSDIIDDKSLSSPQQHEQVCMLLHINRFIPAPTHKLFALRATNIEIYDGSRRILSLGGWYECYSCHTNLNVKPKNDCPECGKAKIQNFKYEEPKKDASPRMFRK